MNENLGSGFLELEKAIKTVFKKLYFKMNLATMISGGIAIRQNKQHRDKSDKYNV